MGNTSSLQASKWDDLFQALTRPDDLKAYLVRNLNPEGTGQSALRTQIELLTGTLQVDLALLKVHGLDGGLLDRPAFNACFEQIDRAVPKKLREWAVAAPKPAATIQPRELIHPPAYRLLEKD